MAHMTVCAVYLQYESAALHLHPSLAEIYLLISFLIKFQEAFLCQDKKKEDNNSAHVCVCDRVSLQYCQWLRRSVVCLPEQTDCPVHQEAKGHQQIPHEEVSLSRRAK